jgi:hypothetical protein
MDIPNQNENMENNNIPDESSLLKYIAGLTPDDIDRLVDVARNRYNNNDSAKDMSKSMTDYFDLLDSVFSSTNFNSIGNSPHTRNQRYEIYDEMDESTAYISSALDILSDDATQADEKGVIIHVTSESSKIQNLVTEFISEFELEEKVSKWARAIAKYGDLFIKVEGEYGTGVSYINDTIYPGIIDRRDLNGKLVAFANNQNTVYSNDDLYAPWEFVHFRHKGDIYKEESNYARLGITKDTFDKNLTSAYGQSILRPAIKVYAQLRFVENMILLSRLTNSIRRNIFLINVGEVAPDKAFDTIANYARLLKKDINMNIEEGIYSASKHTINYDEDIFLPVGDPQNDVRIEQVGGDANIKEQYDLEYLLNKLFSALKVPKAYLNYEQDLNARSTLIQLDIRYARSVSQLQNTLISGIRRLINIHLAYLGLNPDELDLDITLTPVSAIDEEARAEQQQKQISNARDMWDLLSNMKDTLESNEEAPRIDLQSAAEYIMSDYLELDKNLIDKVFNRPTEEVKDMSRIRSHKIYSGTDIHAMYPSEYNQIKYESIRESMLLKES